MNQKGDSDENRFYDLQIGEGLKTIDQLNETMTIAADPKSRLRIDHEMKEQI